MNKCSGFLEPSFSWHLVTLHLVIILSMNCCQMSHAVAHQLWIYIFGIIQQLFSKQESDARSGSVLSLSKKYGVHYFLNNLGNYYGELHLN